jgi:hypothetical protein
MKELPVQLDQMVLQVRTEQLVLREISEPLAQQDQKVLMELSAVMVPQVQLALRVTLDLREQQVYKVLLV